MGNASDLGTNNLNCREKESGNHGICRRAVADGGQRRLSSV
jgi:hypothetical protein